MRNENTTSSLRNPLLDILFYLKHTSLVTSPKSLSAELAFYAKKRSTGTLNDWIATYGEKSNLDPGSDSFSYIETQDNAIIMYLSIP